MQNNPVVHLNRFMLAIAVTGALTVIPAIAVNAEQIYSFVDEAGVVHLSNVPNDPRYQLAAQLAPSAASEVSPVKPLPTLAIEEDPPLPEGKQRFTPITITPDPKAIADRLLDTVHR